MTALHEDAPSFRIEAAPVREPESALVLRLSGRLDGRGRASLEARIAEALRLGQRKIVLECSALESMGEEASAFSAWLKSSAPDGKDVAIAAPSSSVHAAMRRTGLSQFFGVYESEEAAIESLREAVFAGFPHSFRCLVCDRPMQALGSGSILCKECRTMLEVDASGQVAIL